jgi:multiple sugar transport system ATP-binding protein
MPKLLFKNVSKSFGDTLVIKDFSAEIPDNEFLVLLGPSGCGKSTMLRMIAGLIDITEGEIQFDGAIVNNLEPKKRSVAFVFQSYALYPHLTVRANIAFPLLMDVFKWWQHIPLLGSLKRRMDLRNPDLQKKVAEIAQTMELTSYLDRRPKTLSGGQRQRVALARALVRDPSIYLLDEPLSNLDAKLRAQMRVEITNLYHRVAKSFVYVTHDQVEAMTMGTRIILLDGGVIQQHGTPREIYDKPANIFVAKFIGSPPMNLFNVQVNDGVINLPSGDRLELNGQTMPGTPSKRVTLGIRPEKIKESDSGVGVPVIVRVVERLGAETLVAFYFATDSDDSSITHSASSLHYMRIPGDSSLKSGDKCVINFDLRGASWFDPETGVRL